MEPATEPHGIKGLWHSWKGLAEDLHGVELAISVISLFAPSVISWMTGGISLTDSLILTLPLTLAVMLIVVSILTDALGNVEYPIFAYGALTSVVLAVAGFLSHWLGVGRAPDYPAAILRDVGNVHFGWLSVPLGLLNGYFQIYHAGPFFTSVAFGGFLGWRLTRPK